MRILRRHILLNTEPVVKEFKKSLNITVVSTGQQNICIWYISKMYIFNISKVGIHLTIAGVLTIVVSLM